MAVPLVVKTIEQHSISHDISSERLTNCFPKLRHGNKVAGTMLVGSHGWSELGSNSGEDPVRGAMANRAGTEGYIVVGSTFYTVDTGGTRTARGTLETTTSRVHIACGMAQVMVVDGTKGYIYKYSDNSFTTITDPQFPSTPMTVYYSDGYFVTIGTVNGFAMVALSELDDGENWSILNQQAINGADAARSCVVVGRELWVMGNTMSQPMTNTGASGQFPYERVTFTEYGIAAINSVCRTEDTAYWLARTERAKCILVKAQGSTIQPINSEDMNAVFQAMTTVADAYAFSFTDSGQEFIVMTFPTEDQTWVYMPKTGHFWKWELQDGSRFIANCYMFLNNRHVIGSRTNSKLFVMSLDTFTEGDGNTPIKRQVITPTQFDADKTIHVPKMKVYLDSSQFGNSTPSISIETSGDGGTVYRAPKNSSPIRAGKHYCQFNRISAARRLTFKLTFNEALPFRLVNLTAYMRSVGR